MSDSNRVKVSYVKETTFGITPTGNLQVARITGETLAQTTTTKASDEIRPDRQTADILRTDINGGGALNFELSYGSQEDWFLATLMAASWSSPVAIGAAITVSAAASDQSFNSTGTPWGSIVAGQWIKVAGFAGANNNGIFKVVTATSAKLIVVGATLLTIEAAGPSVTITQGAQIVNGVALASYSLERQYTDLTNIFSFYKGMVPSKLSLTCTSQAILTGSIEFSGVSETSGTTSIGTGYTASNTNGVLNAIDNVTALLEGGVATDITEFSLAIANNLRLRNEVAHLGPVSIGAGEFSVSGALKCFFSTVSIIAKYLSFTSSSLALLISDSNGQYILEFPCVKYTDGKRVAGGKSQDIIADMTFMAKMDPTTGITMRIAKF